jgi:hypothetical protein
MPYTITEIGGRSMRIGSNFERRYERTFRILTDDPLADGLLVYQSLGLTPGMPYQSQRSQDLYAWITDIDITEETSSEDHIEWTAKVQYGPWEPQNEDPRLNPPEVDLSFVEFEELVVKDAETGEPIVNSAGDLYADPPVMRDGARAVLTVKRNEPNYSLALASTYANTVNASALQIGDIGFGPKQVLAKPIVAQRAFNSFAGFYWPTTYQFHLRITDTWQAKLLDRGFRRLVSGERLQICNDDGHPVTEPAFLDGAGQPLDVGDDGVFLTFDQYPLRDFSVFNGLF